MRKEKITPGYVLSYVVLIFWSLTTIYPIIWILQNSFKTKDKILENSFAFPVGDLFTTANYRKAFGNLNIGQAYINSIFISGCVTIFVVLFAGMAAFAFARINFRGKNVVFAMVMAAMMIPSATLLIPQFMIWKALKGIDTYAPLILGAFGAPGFYTFMLRQFYKGIPMDMDEAARIDGASPLDIYLKIIIPLSKAPLVTVAIFTFTSCWNDFMGPLIYLSSEEKYTAALGLRSFIGMYTGQWHYLMAASTVLVIPVIILFAFCQKIFINGINLSGGLKG